MPEAAQLEKGGGEPGQSLTHSLMVSLAAESLGPRDGGGGASEEQEMPPLSGTHARGGCTVGAGPPPQGCPGPRSQHWGSREERGPALRPWLPGAPQPPLGGGEPPAHTCTEVALGMGGAGRQSTFFREKAQGRDKETLRDGPSESPPSLSHPSRNPGLTLEPGVKAPCLGPSLSQRENRQGPWKPSLQGRWPAGGGCGVSLDMMAAELGAGQPSPGDLGTLPVVRACKSQPSLNANKTLSPPDLEFVWG